MAVTVTRLDHGADTTGASSYATSSVAPTGNRLQLLGVVTSQGGSANPTKPTASGNGITWVEIGDIITKNSGTNRTRLTVFRGLVASPSAGVTTIDYGGVNQTGCIFVWLEADGASTSGTNGSGAIAQSKESPEPGAAATSITLTADAAGTDGNVFSMFINHFANESLTGNGGWTATLSDDGHSNPGNAAHAIWNNTHTDNSGNATWSTSAECSAFLIEIQAAPAPVAITGESGGVAGEVATIGLALLLSGDSSGVAGDEGTLILATLLSGESLATAGEVPFLYTTSAISGESLAVAGGVGTIGDPIFLEGESLDTAGEVATLFSYSILVGDSIASTADDPTLYVYRDAFGTVSVQRANGRIKIRRVGGRITVDRPFAGKVRIDE